MFDFKDLRDSVFSPANNALPADQIVAIAAKNLRFLGIEVDPAVGDDRPIELTIGDLREAVKRIEEMMANG